MERYYENYCSEDYTYDHKDCHMEKPLKSDAIMDKVQFPSPQSTAQVPSSVHTIPCWEDEFGDELLGIPLMEAKKGFDPVNDLDELEALLYGEPIVEIKESHQENELQVKESTNEQMIMVTDPLLCIKDNRPMDEHDGGSLPKSNVPRERAWSKAGQPKLKAR
ncbi:hypothetical protein HanIR_Chr10g0458381 [Helianthus annuus]|nr:hypothetical protein HanIR_Chr10g0458381 [Helianthus annuus]